MTGIDVAEAARAGVSTSSSSPPTTSTVDAFERDAVDYLLKPVSGERLAATVEQQLESRLAAGAPAPEVAAQATRRSRAICRSAARSTAVSGSRGSVRRSGRRCA